MDRYRHMNMVFTYINHLKTWECELTTDREYRIKFYGYVENARDVMDEAILEYQNAPESVRKPL